MRLGRFPIEMFLTPLRVHARSNESLDPFVAYRCSRATAIASSERERNRLRRMPCSTWTTARAAALDPIHRKSTGHSIQLTRKSRLRISPGVPATISSRSSSRLLDSSQQVDQSFPARPLLPGSSPCCGKVANNQAPATQCSEPPARLDGWQDRSPDRSSMRGRLLPAPAAPQEPGPGGFNSGRLSASNSSSSAAGKAPRRWRTVRERIVGSNSCGFSVSRMSDVCAGGSSRTFNRLLAASFINAEDVKIVKVRFDSTGGR